MSVTKNVIITVGMCGVGKSRYADLWIKDHPEYVCVPCIGKWDEYTDVILQHEYVVMDYYFAQDYNAERLKKKLNCPVEIIVLFDSPENISYRQVYLKEQGVGNNIDCYHSKYVHSHDLRALIDVRRARFIDGDYKEYTHEGFREKNNEYWKPYTKEQVEEYVSRIDAIDEYDKYYQEFELPHGIRIGKKDYSMNVPTWDVIHDWVDWKHRPILDLCCNHGYFSQQIWWKGGIPTGCDIHQHAIYTAAVFAKMNGVDYKLFRCDINSEFPTGHFEIVMLFNVFHHLREPDRVLERMAKYPISLFEVNDNDVGKIEAVFEIVHSEKSPKANRTLLMGKPIKGKRNVTRQVF